MTIADWFHMHVAIMTAFEVECYNYAMIDALSIFP